MTKLVAVYGSLRKRLSNHRLLANSEFLGEPKTSPSFEMFSLGGFPGIRDGNNSITIEVYAVNEGTSQSLDRLEGYRGPDSPNNFYNKETIKTEFGDASIYTLKNERYSDSQIVESGNWTEYRNA